MFQWKYVHDVSGNVISIDFGIGDTPMAYGSGDRVSKVLDADVSYDANGRQTSRFNTTFVYNDFSQLVEARNADDVAKFYYDANGRVSIVKSEKNTGTNSIKTFMA